MSTIYAIVDEVGTPVYVGQTQKKLSTRFSLQRSSARRNSRPLDLWLRDHPHASIMPLETRPDDADEAERRWIRQMREGGVALLNVHDGGRKSPSGVPLTAGHKAILSNFHTGRKRSPEHRAKLSAAHTGVPLSPKHREAIGRGGKGRIVTPEQRENMAAAKRGQANPMSRTNRARREGVV